MAMEKENKMKFEIIDIEAIESVKRGRKPIVLTEVVEMMKQVPAGKAFAIAQLSVDTKAGEKETKTAKASASAIIRSQAKIAGWKKVGISWGANGVPFAKHLA